MLITNHTLTNQSITYRCCPSLIDRDIEMMVDNINHIVELGKSLGYSDNGGVVTNGGAAPGSPMRDNRRLSMENMQVMTVSLRTMFV